MADNKTTQVVETSVDFSGDASGIGYRPRKLVFEMDDRRDEEQYSKGAVRIRRYPGVSSILFLGGFGGGPMGPEDMGYNYNITEGDLYETVEIRERYVKGSLSLSGVSEAELPYPVTRDLVLRVNGRLYSATGGEVSPNIHYNNTVEKVFISRPVYGKLDYEYYTNYSIFRYFPTKYADSEIYFEVDISNYGELLAFPRIIPEGDTSSIITFQVQPPPTVSGEFEVYRVVSTGIINQEGSWEKPSGWPTVGTFLGKTDTIDTSGSYMEVERVHVIGYLRLGSSDHVNSQYASRENALASPLADKIARDSGAAQQYALSTGKQVANMDGYLKRGASRAGKVSVREVIYEVPWAKPYEAEAPEVFRVVYCTGGNGQKITTVSEVQYKRVLTVKASKPPLAPVGKTDKDTINSINYDDQANRVNAYMHQAYSMIDWQAIRANLPTRFNSAVYEQLVFDSSVPQK